MATDTSDRLMSSGPPDQHGEPVVHIKPGAATVRAALHELAQARDLIRFLIWRDLLVRYKQTALGVAWAVLQPLSLMAVFAIFLGRLARVPSDGFPYPVFVLSGLVLWSFFAQAFLAASRSVVDQANLVSKVYFQRLALPISSACSHLVELLVPFALLVILLPLYGVGLRASMFLAPAFGLIALITALAMGILFAAVNVRWRDVAQALPFVTQVWMFATPVVYPASLVPDAWRIVYGLNPMAGAVEGFRWSVLGAPPPDAELLVASVVVAVLLLALAVARFVRLEATFSDVI